MASGCSPDTGSSTVASSDYERDEVAKIIWILSWASCRQSISVSEVGVLYAGMRLAALFAETRFKDDRDLCTSNLPLLVDKAS